MESSKSQYRVQDFLPLIVIMSIIIIFTLVRQSMQSTWNLMAAMQDFMAGFFLVFGIVKLLNLKGFAEAYATYDLIAAKSQIYAYAYPFIEIGLGLAYLMRWNLPFTNLITLIVMLISAVGVFNELRKQKPIMCACLGVVFKIPMTYVTLAEDLLMAVMALIMLILK